MSRSARTRRLTLAFMLIALVALLDLVVARSLPSPAPSASATTSRPTARPTLQSYALYMFSAQFPDTNAPVYQGQMLLVTWQPQLDTSRRVYGPTPVECSVALLGPFSSAAIAERVADTLHGGNPPFTTPSAVANTIPLALEGPTLTLNGLSDTAQSSTLMLPNSLTPGYYVLDSYAIGIDGSYSSDEVLLVEAAPPVA